MKSRSEDGYKKSKNNNQVSEEHTTYIRPCCLQRNKYSKLEVLFFLRDTREIENINSPIFSKEIELLIRTLSIKKILGSGGFITRKQYPNT